MHNDFTLFMRTYPNETRMVFYHAYNEKDERVGPIVSCNIQMTQ